MRTTLTLLGLALMPVSAQAAILTFNGSAAGTDPLGGNYAVVTSPANLTQFEEIAGIQTDDTKDVLFNPAGSGLINATSFTLTITDGSTKFIPLDLNFGNYFETFDADSNILSVWTATENADRTSITYTADPGDELLAGERFGTISTFTATPASYTVTWAGEAAPVPEVASWAMMVVGFGAVGGAMRRRRHAIRFA